MKNKISDFKTICQPTLLVSSFFIFILLSCSTNNDNDCHSTLFLKNNSNYPIYYVTTLEEEFFNYDPTNEMYATDFYVASGESQKVRIGITLSCWEQVMSSVKGYLCIYIYDANFLETEGWDGNSKKYIKKFKLNASQLNKMNWVVQYP